MSPIYRNLLTLINWLQWTNFEPLWEPGTDTSFTDTDEFAEQLMLSDANSVSPHLATFPEHQAVDADNFARAGYGPAQEARGPSFDASDCPVLPSDGVSSRSSSDHSSASNLEQTRPSEPSSAQSASRSSGKTIICQHLECSGLQFDQIAEWRKHNERVHDRHQCPIPRCGKSFGSKGELFRHRQTKHNQLPSHKRLRCPIMGCRYSQVPHFKRKDNLTNHLKSMHQFSPADAKARTDEANAQAKVRHRSSKNWQAESQSSATLQLQPVSPAVAAVTALQHETSSEPPHSAISDPPDTRRLGKPGLAPDDASIATPTTASHNELEMWKDKAAKYEFEKGLLQDRELALQMENESLKNEVVRLRRCEESLIAAVLAATRKT